MTDFTQTELQEAAAVIGFDRVLKGWRRRRPSDWYQPTRPSELAKDGRVLGWTANQLAFHQSKHIVRGLFPGNGWGKSTCVAAEANAWGFHTNEWQVTPSRPVAMVWFCKLYDQFELLRKQLEREVFGDDVRYLESDGRYVWPDGSEMSIASADKPGSWKKRQGAGMDLAIFDEEPPLELFREMKQRRRADSQTRYVISATATESGSWMEREIYAPWLEHHKAQGLDIKGAMLAQNHSDYFVWPRGGIRDNRGASAADIAWYEKQTWASAKEREVRLFGGFQNWVGDPVFDPAAMDTLAERCRVLTASSSPPIVGMFEIDPKVEPRRASRDARDQSALIGRPVTELTPQELRNGRFIVGPVPDPRGSVRIYVPPAIGQTCVIGADFAYGLEGRDLDTAVVFDKSVTPVRHLATVAGRWGERFDRVLYALAMYYGGAFILGERQVGLPTLRRLLSEYLYTYLYYGRNEHERHRAVSDKLGHPRTYDDITLRNLRRAAIDGLFELRDDSIIDQMGRLKYHSKTELTTEGKVEDYRLKITLAGGGSPDLVMATCYAWHACGEVEHFEQAKPLFETDSMGAALGYEDLYREQAKPIGIPFGRRTQR